MLPTYLLLVLLLALCPCRCVILTSPDEPGVTISHTGQVISAEKANHEFIAATECQCHLQCAVQGGQCVGYSYSLNKTCRLSSSYSLGVPDSQGVYLYYLPNGLPKETFKRDDGLYYYYNKKQDYNFTQAIEQCLTLPGYRLTQAKTTQTAEILKKIHKDANFRVHLSRLQGGTPEWGDGTPLKSSVAEPRNDGTTATVYYDVGLIFIGAQFGWCSPEMLAGYVCQANYEDQPW